MHSLGHVFGVFITENDDINSYSDVVAGVLCLSPGFGRDRLNGLTNITTLFFE